jgi:hypothetical protein
MSILDESYKSINDILQKPIFFDSVEIRQVVSAIRECHNAIILIANNLTNNVGMIGEIDKESQEKEESK